MGIQLHPRVYGLMTDTLLSIRKLVLRAGRLPCRAGRVVQSCDHRVGIAEVEHARPWSRWRLLFDKAADLPSFTLQDRAS